MAEPEAAVCCQESGGDPYACEAEDCTYPFAELNPFGPGGPFDRERNAKVSAACPQCTWRSSVWHVDDGSAEYELHEHIARRHGGSTTA